MKNPVHPGRIVRHDCLEPLGLSVTAGAKILGVTRQTLNNVVNGKSGISPEMAIRLTKAFGSTPETWLRMQLAYDLAAALKDEGKIKVLRQPVPQDLHFHLRRTRRQDRRGPSVFHTRVPCETRKPRLTRNLLGGPPKQGVVTRGRGMHWSWRSAAREVVKRFDKRFQHPTETLEEENRQGGHEN